MVQGMKLGFHALLVGTLLAFQLIFSGGASADQALRLGTNVWPGYEQLYLNYAQATPREREVFDQLIIGHANKVVARVLDCSPRTVEIHRARIMEKLEATSVAQLVRMALSVGIEITDD